jgi:uncharacterized protein (TIGR02246 family)
MKSRFKLWSVLSVLTTLTGCANYTSNAAPSSVPSMEVAKGHESTCQTMTEQQVTSLFSRWNDSLKTRDADKVVANYAQNSILLPTVSNKPRLTEAEKKDYFEHFLENQPTGKIDQRQVFLGCNSAVDAGLYTFTFGKTGAVVRARYTYTYGWDGKNWLITSHHSSAMPEK